MGGLVDGALLQSPTREKLEPVIPRRKEDNYEAKAHKSTHSAGKALISSCIYFIQYLNGKAFIYTLKPT